MKVTLKRHNVVKIANSQEEAAKLVSQGFKIIDGGEEKPKPKASRGKKEKEAPAGPPADGEPDEEDEPETEDGENEKQD